MLPQYPGWVKEEQQTVLNKFEEELKGASLDARGLTIPTESVVPGVEVEWPAEEARVELSYNKSPGVRLILITKLRFTENVEKAPLNEHNSPYGYPQFYGVAYAGDEPLGVLRPLEYGWMNVPEKFEYNKQVPKDVEVYLKMNLDISSYEPHHYDDISKIVICSYNSPQAEIYNGFSIFSSK